MGGISRNEISRALQFAGVPLSVGDLVAGNAAHDFLTSVNHATVLGTIAQRQCNVVRPFIGLVVPWRALMGRSGSGARDQAPIDGNAGYRVAIIAAGEHEGLLMAEVNNRDDVRLALERKFLRRCDLQRASAVDLHNSRKIGRILDRSKVRIPLTRGSDGQSRHSLAIQYVRNREARHARFEFPFPVRLFPCFMFAVQVRAEEEDTRAKYRDSRNPEEHFPERRSEEHTSELQSLTN